MGEKADKRKKEREKIRKAHEAEAQQKSFLDQTTRAQETAEKARTIAFNRNVDLYRPLSEYINGMIGPGFELNLDAFKQSPVSEAMWGPGGEDKGQDLFGAPDARNTNAKCTKCGNPWDASIHHDTSNPDFHPFSAPTAADTAWQSPPRPPGHEIPGLYDVTKAPAGVPLCKICQRPESDEIHHGSQNPLDPFGGHAFVPQDSSAPIQNVSIQGT